MTLPAGYATLRWANYAELWPVFAPSQTRRGPGTPMALISRGETHEFRRGFQADEHLSVSKRTRGRLVSQGRIGLVGGHRNVPRMEPDQGLADKTRKARHS